MWGGGGGQRRVNDSVREWRSSPAIHHPTRIYDVDVHCEQNSTDELFNGWPGYLPGNSVKIAKLLVFRPESR